MSATDIDRQNRSFHHFDGLLTALMLLMAHAGLLYLSHSAGGVSSNLGVNHAYAQYQGLNLLGLFALIGSALSFCKGMLLATAAYMIVVFVHLVVRLTTDAGLIATGWHNVFGV